MSNDFDLYIYSGPVSVDGYHALCERLKERKCDKAILALATFGGDPNAGFRIARALQHEYGSFAALVPRCCKSAGTLIAIGASELYMDNMSELGPLDIQIKKGDELNARSSGLDIIEAISFLKQQTIATFQEQLDKLTSRGLSTRTASDIATTLTRGIFEPIASQIDPLKLAEFQRANDITMAYGLRLAEVGKNLHDPLFHSLLRLVMDYPSHGFAIDRKEARTIFKGVKPPLGELKTICDNVAESTYERMFSINADVIRQTISLEARHEEHNPQHQGDGADCHQRANEALLQAGNSHLCSQERVAEGNHTRNGKPRVKKKPGATKD